MFLFRQFADNTTLLVLSFPCTLLCASTIRSYCSGLVSNSGHVLTSVSFCTVLVLFLGTRAFFQRAIKTKQNLIIKII